ncbi:MAG: SUMF1/EgtB/PvdO family nonheme iron enzyme [Nitrospinaceae bacterium]|nr:SUMF1/EgtB/PvdO family nonheme iron enzyme [Nitrospina sp.]MBT5867858.1 SUMF1/EgtB/PvdO family nonheme iron enzyme [Nitrospinaceae bacterium]
MKNNFSKNLRTLTGLMLALLLSGCATFLQKQNPQNMVFVPQGPFSMGFEIENDHEWGDIDEDPVHEVTLSPYWIDKYEVTSAEFAEFLNSNLDSAHRYIEITPSVTIKKLENQYQPRPGLENLPANRVSWYGADAYCRWKGKRLPTEAEWEKAARGNDQRIFPWGNEYPDNSRVTFRRKFSELGFKAMEPVDSMPQGVSPYGVHHMAGNVWEWVDDWFGSATYEDEEQKDPTGPETGVSKVLRGGNWYYKAYYMRTTYRFNEKPDQFNIWQGFRCAQRDASDN